MAKHQHVVGGGLAVLTLILGATLVFEDGIEPSLQPAEQAARAGDVFVGPIGGITDGKKSSVTGNKIGDILVTASVSPILSPMSPSVSPIITPIPLESAQPTSSTTPRATPTAFPSPQPSVTTLPTPQASSTPSPSASSTPFPPVLPVVISEIGWMGTKANSSDEWIELYNPNTMAISIEGWFIRSEAEGVPAALLTGKLLSGTIPGKGCYILERSDEDTLSSPAQWAEPFGGNGLSNQGEKLTLLNDRSEVEDTVGGQGMWYAGDSVTKASMERIDPGAPGNSLQNWRTSSYLSTVLDQAGNRIIGTPGFRE